MRKQLSLIFLLAMLLSIAFPVWHQHVDVSGALSRIDLVPGKSPVFDEYLGWSFITLKPQANLLRTKYDPATLNDVRYSEPEISIVGTLGTFAFLTLVLFGGFNLLKQWRSLSFRKA